MENASIAKTKLQTLTRRTEKDLYVLRYESSDFMPLTEDTYFTVKSICNENNLDCPLYKYGGEVKFRQTVSDIYAILHTLADDHGIYLDYSKINR